MIARLIHALNINPGEEQLVGWLLLHSFFMGILLTFAETAAYTLFLIRYDSGILPLVYISASVITVITGVIYTQIEKRVSFQRLLLLNLSTVLLTLILFRVAFNTTDNPLPALIAVIGYDVLWVLVSLEFWGLAGRVFTVRQGRRLFGLIGSGEMLATMAGGALIPLLMNFIDAADLFYVAAGGTVGAIIIMSIITRRYDTDGATVTDDASIPKPARKDRSIRKMFSDRYLLMTFAFAGLSVATIYFADNAFYNQAELQYPDSDALAAFLGVFLAISSVAQLAMRLVGSGWILSRAGLLAGLLTLPGSLFIGSLLVAGAAVMNAGTAIIFGLVMLVKLCDKAFRYSINRAAGLVLYQPLTTGERVRAQTITESIIEPLAGILSGVVLLILNQAYGVDAAGLLIAMLGIIVVWLVVIIALNREYRSSLLKALNQRLLGGTHVRFDDGSSLKILLDTLASPHAGEVIYALNTLEQIESVDLQPHLVRLLQHPAEAVRRTVLQKITTLPADVRLTALTDWLQQEPLPELRGNILRILAQLAQYDEIVPWLDDPEPVVRRDALIALLQSDDHSHYQQTLDRLHTLAGSETVQDRIMAAEVTGDVNITEADALLRQLLHDDNSSVQQAAVTAAGKVQHPDLYPLIIDNLESSHNGLTATIQTLSAAGDEIMPLLVARFNKTGQPRHVQLRLLRIMSSIGGETIIDWLKQQLMHPDEFVRYYVLESLRMCGYELASTDRPMFDSALQSEIIGTVWTLASLRDIAAVRHDNDLLDRALQQELDLNRRRILILLSFFYDVDSIITVENNYNDRDEAKRAYALEILDITLDNQFQHKQTLLQLLDSTQSPADILSRLDDRYHYENLTFIGRLKQLFDGNQTQYVHPWTRACAIYTAAQAGDTELAMALSSALDDIDPVIRETAVWALNRLSPAIYQVYMMDMSRDTTIKANQVTMMTMTALQREEEGGREMLLTVEKVIILRTVSIFSETPEDLLAEIAMVLEEVEVAADETIIHQGETGNALYIIASGSVRVHAGEQTIATLGEREVVGELALLDSAPRSASVTTQEDTVLLKLNQDAFYELITNNPEVVRGVMRVLARRIRTTSRQQ